MISRWHLLSGMIILLLALIVLHPLGFLKKDIPQRGAQNQFFLQESKSILSDLSLTSSSQNQISNAIQPLTTILIHKDLDLTPVALPPGKEIDQLVQQSSYFFGKSKNDMDFWKITATDLSHDLGDFLSFLQERANNFQGNLEESQQTTATDIANIAAQRGWQVSDIHYNSQKNSWASPLSPDYLYEQGKKFHSQKMFYEAIDAYKNALFQLHSSADKDSRHFSLLFNIGLSYKELHGIINEKTALAYFQWALADLINNYPEVQKWYENADQAMEFHAASQEQAREYQQTAQKFAKCYRNIGSGLIALGEFQAAVNPLGLAAKIDESSGDLLSLAKDNIFRANASWFLGDYERAFQFYQGVYALGEKLKIDHGEDSSREYKLEALIGIGNCAGELGFPAYALEAYQKGLEFIVTGKNLRTSATLYRSIGETYRNIAEQTKQRSPSDLLAPEEMVQYAQNYLNKSIEISENIATFSDLASSLNLLSDLYLWEGDWAKALTAIKRSEQYYAEKEDFRGLAMTYLQAAKILIQKETSRVALNSAARPENPSSRETNESNPHSFLALLLAQYRPNDTANNTTIERILEKSYEYALAMNWREGLWKIQCQKGTFYRQVHRDQEALAAMRDALNITEDIRAKLKNVNTNLGFIRSKVAMYRDTVELLKTLEKNRDVAHYGQLQNEWEQKLNDRRMRAKIEKTIQNTLSVTLGL
jgi:hypothetical protein